jgi:hypothetical protein
MSQDKVRGQSIPGPRLTPHGAMAIALYLGLPVLGALTLVDLLLYVVFTRLLGRCYGVLCWFS